MMLLETIARWWQSMGFGIQSKSDYAFLHDVLREKNRYYAYDDMQQAFPHAPGRQHEAAQLLFRILNNARGRQTTIVGQLSDIEMMACRLSKAQPRITDTITHFHNIDTLIVKAISTSNNELWDRVLQTNAVTFDIKGETGIALFHKSRFPQHYRI